MLKEEVIGFEALCKSAHKCCQGVMWKGSVARFMLNEYESIDKLSKELMNGTYRAGEKVTFWVTDPKPRQIVSIPFRDRVYQRSLNDNVLYPQITKHLIYDNCACQIGKGTDFARERLKSHLQRFARKNSLKNGYVLQCDIKSYYDTMRHNVVKSIFKRYIEDDWAYDMAAEIIDSYPGKVGFNPGSQLVQIAGISALNDVDHYIKEQLRVKHYIRYMDDMILLCNSKEEAEKFKEEITVQLKFLGFSLHPTKTRIYRIKEGIPFLGFTFFIQESLRIYMQPNAKRVHHERKKLYRLAKRVKLGKIDKDKFDQCYASWSAHVSKGNTYKLQKRMQQYKEGLINVKPIYRHGGSYFKNDS